MVRPLSPDYQQAYKVYTDDNNVGSDVDQRAYNINGTHTLTGQAHAQNADISNALNRQSGRPENSSDYRPQDVVDHWQAITTGGLQAPAVRNLVERYDQAGPSNPQRVRPHGLDFSNLHHYSNDFLAGLYDQEERDGTTGGHDFTHTGSSLNSLHADSIDSALLRSHLEGQDWTTDGYDFTGAGSSVHSLHADPIDSALLRSHLEGQDWTTDGYDFTGVGSGLHSLHAGSMDAAQLRWGSEYSYGQGHKDSSDLALPVQQEKGKQPIYGDAAAAGNGQAGALIMHAPQPLAFGLQHRPELDAAQQQAVPERDIYTGHGHHIRKDIKSEVFNLFRAKHTRKEIAISQGLRYDQVCTILRERKRTPISAIPANIQEEISQHHKDGKEPIAIANLYAGVTVLHVKSILKIYPSADATRRWRDKKAKEMAGDNATGKEYDKIVSLKNAERLTGKKMTQREANRFEKLRRYRSRVDNPDATYQDLNESIRLRVKEIKAAKEKPMAKP